MDGTRNDSIAIVGIAGRFPGARDVEELWRNLCAGREGIRDLSVEDLERAGVPERLRDDPRWVRRAAILEQAEHFDAPFFGFSPREALVTDPQQRLLLELAVEAFEDAGLVPARLSGAVGVFVGASRSDYAQRVQADPSHAAALGDFFLEIATSRDFLATRIAYALGLRGPALSVQTACSTSLVAVHLACQSLLAGECELALAGGVSIRLPQGTGYLSVEGGVASPDGRCRAFDARAQGTLPGNGGALVLLRPLADALSAGDPIHALILASAVNNDGRNKVGFTAPGVAGQAAVIEEALALADVSPDSIGMIEAHGTGTPLGDPIEVAALAEAFARRGGRARAGSCALGSLKSNLGHLDAAAGIAGLVKAALCVGRGMIPPSVSFESPNPALALERTPFRIATELGDSWPRGGPRRAGVSSFGIGGTNAHALLEEPPEHAAAPPGAGLEIAVLSARSAPALERARERLARRLEEVPTLAAREVAFTLQTGRTEFAERACALGGDARELAAALRADDLVRGRALDPAPQVAFLFPGQGNQRVGMGLRLYGDEPVFRRELERARERFAHSLELDLLHLLEDGAALSRTEGAQPALFALEHALARQWMAFGIEPAAMLGHSLGELVAATLAGVLGLEDALELVVARGRSMQGVPEGAMLAVSLSEESLREWLGAGLGVASINAPALTVVSGAIDAIEELERRLGAAGVPAKRLATSHAFHSPLMEGARGPFLAALRRVELRPPERPFLSNVSGTWIRPEQATSPEYWAEQLLAPVRLFPALGELQRQGGLITLEVGPGRSFAAPARAAGLLHVCSLPGRGLDAHETRELRGALGRLWTLGVGVDWSALQGEPSPRRVHLPTYPFERRAYLAGAPPRAQHAAGATEAERAPKTVSGDIAAAVARAWQECLGLDEVSAEDDFFELGGSSLLAIGVRGRLERELGMEVALGDLLEATRLRELVRRLEAARSTPAEPRSALVPMGQGRTKLYAVPGIDGETAAFAALARALAPDCALLALRAPGLEGGAAPCSDVERLAETYVAALRADGPGPYHLAGHSFGGRVAFEMARRLRAQGDAPASLSLVDTYLALPAELTDETGAVDEQSLWSVARRYLAHLDVAPEDRAFERRLAVFVAHSRAAHAHRPRPYEGAALLVFAREGERGAQEECARAWGALARGGLRLETVPGNHNTMLTPPHVRELARVLAAWVGSASLSIPKEGRT